FYNRFGDYSYGIYLWGFPMQQLVVYWLGSPTPTRITLLAWPLALICAVLSWRLIEKPSIALGRRFIRAPEAAPSAATGGRTQPAVPCANGHGEPRPFPAQRRHRADRSRPPGWAQRGQQSDTEQHGGRQHIGIEAEQRQRGQQPRQRERQEQAQRQGDRHANQHLAQRAAEYETQHATSLRAERDAHPD